MIRVHTCAQGRVETADAPAELTPPAAKCHVWVEAVQPDPAALARILAPLGVHELALEDALSQGHPPKLEDYGDHLFAIVHTPTLVRGDGATTRKVSILLGKQWVVTILREALPPLEALADRVRRDPKRYCASPDLLAHTVVDFMVDGFERVVDECEDRVEQLESLAQADQGGDVLAGVLELRRDVATLARLVRAQRDVCNGLHRGPHAALSKKVQPYFRDAYDHMLRLDNALDAIRENVGAVRDAHLSLVNNRLNATMRTLTVIATIMLPLTVITGVFGMNFVELPGSHHPAGFWLTCIGMLALGVGMLWVFRRRRWL